MRNERRDSLIETPKRRDTLLRIVLVMLLLGTATVSLYNIKLQAAIPYTLNDVSYEASVSEVTFDVLESQKESAKHILSFSESGYRGRQFKLTVSEEEYILYKAVTPDAIDSDVKQWKGELYTISFYVPKREGETVVNCLQVYRFSGLGQSDFTAEERLKLAKHFKDFVNYDLVSIPMPFVSNWLQNKYNCLTVNFQIINNLEIEGKIPVVGKVIPTAEKHFLKEIL